MTQIDMQNLEVAMKYIERIADGKNPVNNKPTEEDAVLNNPKEYLVDVLDRYTGKMRPQVTESGTVFGLYMEERSSMRGEPYNIIMYSQRAQEFIAANLEKIVNNSI